MKTHERSSIQCIIPPYIFEKMLESKEKATRDAAFDAVCRSSQMRGERNIASRGGGSSASASANGRRTVFDCENRWTTSNATVGRSENGPASSDEVVNRLFDGLGKTRDFFKDVFNRDSLDGNGIRLDGYVHFGVRHLNAGFNGSVMLFGDGDDDQFTDFTKSLDVIAHELGHGVTQYTADLIYNGQSGALNESMSDVFGSLVKQWVNGEDAASADWLIGAEIWTPGFAGDALRSMKSPGKAFNHPVFGKDPQPDHMSKYDHGPGDNQMVHTNSGIPNKAFFLTAIGIGGNAWEAPGHIWYESLLASNPSTDFQQFADTTYIKAGSLYGTGSQQQRAVTSAWKEVGIRISGSPSFASSVSSRLQPSGDTLADLTKQIESLTKQVGLLAKDVKSIKGSK
jgi:Zn-dependent metalloprotease